MKKNYTYGFVEGTNITLFDNLTLNFNCSTTDALQDVTAEIDDKGNLHIKGKKLVYDFYGSNNKVWENEWRNTPHPKLIKEGKRFFLSKLERYVEGGWVRTDKTIQVEYVFSNYKITIEE